MECEYWCQPFDEFPRRSQSLCNERCQNILYKAVFEHFNEIKSIAVLLLTSKSFQNSSFGANFLVNFIADNDSIRLIDSVLSPSSCFSLQFAPSIRIRQPWGDSGKVDRRVCNFVHEIVNTKYFHVSLRSLTMESVSNEVLPLFFGSSSRNAWPQLQYLSLENSGLNDSVLEIISKTALQLRAVNISKNSAVTDVGLECISNLSDITSLNLTWCNSITDSGFEPISNLSCITLLNLSFCQSFTDVGLEHVAKLSNLRSLDLSFCNEITDAGLEHLSTLAKITSLNLLGCDNVTDAGLQHVAELSSITDLNLSGCYLISDAGLEHVSQLLGIITLSIYNINPITDIGLEHLSKLSKLTSLNLAYCNKITADAKKKFKETLPNCKF